MNYLKRVYHTLKGITWEKFGVALNHSVRSLLIIVVAAVMYWGIDQAIMSLF